MCEGINNKKIFIIISPIIIRGAIYIIIIIYYYTVLVFILASDHRSSIRVFIISTIVKSMIESSYILASLPSSFYARAPPGRDGS